MSHRCWGQRRKKVPLFLLHHGGALIGGVMARFIGVSLAFIVIRDNTGNQGGTDALKRGWWYKGGGFVVLSDFADGMRRIWVQCSTETSPVDVAQQHVCRCLQRAYFQLINPRWRWCSFGACNDGGSASLLKCTSAALGLCYGH